MINSISHILFFVALILLAEGMRTIHVRVEKLEIWIKEHKDMIPYDREKP